MKRQGKTFFSGTNKKNISIFRLLRILARVLSVKGFHKSSHRIDPTYYYENTPIQIYRKFLLQKFKISDKKL